MSELYNLIQGLCSKKGVTITDLCRESGASRGSLTDLKMGRKKGLSSETLSKLADYFDVSVDYLLGKEERPATGNGDKPRKIEDKDIQFALFGGGEVTEEAWEDVKDFVQFIRAKYKLDDKKGASKGDSQ